MPYDVEIKQVPPQSVVSWKTRTNLDSLPETFSTGFGVLMAALAAAGTAPAGAPFAMYHDVIDEQTEGTIEICIPVPPGEAGPKGEVDWKEVPGARVAWTTHHGPYDELSPAYHTLTGWMSEHGHQVTGVPREVYLNDPNTALPEDLLTEIQFPVRDPASG
jgi:effector-binding domain-containing protein